MGASPSQGTKVDDESVPLLQPVINNNTCVPMNRSNGLRHHHHRHRIVRNHEQLDFGLAVGIFQWKGTVLSRIWPTVLFFMIYTTAVVFIPTRFVMESADTTSVTILGIILGSLLGIRTNAAYERYMQGCMAWNNVINQSRNFVRLLMFTRVTVPPTPAQQRLIATGQRQALSLLYTFSVSTYKHLQYESDYAGAADEAMLRAAREQQQGDQQLPQTASNKDATIRPSQYNSIPTTDHSVNDVSAEPQNLPIATLNALQVHLTCMQRQGWLEPGPFNSLTGIIGSLGEQLVTMERIVNTPMPLPYLVHLRQVIVLFCIILPLQVASKLHYWTIPMVGFTVFTYEGIDTIGKEIEDPFGFDHNDLPVNGYCLQIKEEIERFFPPTSHVDEESQRDGDNDKRTDSLFGQVQRYTRAYECYGIHVAGPESASLDGDLENQLIDYVGVGSLNGSRSSGKKNENGRSIPQISVAADDLSDMAPLSTTEDHIAPVTDLS